MRGGLDGERGTPQGIVVIEGENVGYSGGVLGRRRECYGRLFIVCDHLSLEFGHSDVLKLMRKEKVSVRQ